MSTVWTIGHSTRSIEEFVSMLKGNDIELLVDIRSLPGSKRFPHFNTENMRQWLPEYGIQYSHNANLGGLRKGHKDMPSVNLGWRNLSFRNYADYMQTGQFEIGMLAEEARARVFRCAYMCSEAVPWRCHRSLVADAFLARGWDVLDIMSETKTAPHKMTPFAVVCGCNVTYPEMEEAA